MRTPDDPRLYVGLQAGGLALLAASFVVGLETGSSQLVVAGLLSAVLLLVGARVVHGRSGTPGGRLSRALFWSDLVIVLATIGYLAQSNPSGATLALIMAGGMTGWCGASLLRDVFTRTVQSRTVTRLALLMAAIAGTVAYFLYATGVGWHPAWVTQLLIIAAVSGLIGFGVGLVLLLQVTGRLTRRAGDERTN